MTRRVRASLAMGALLGTLACASQPPAPVPPVTLSVSGRTSATPSIESAGRTVVVAWGATAGEATHVFAAVSRDAGATFSAPVQVSDEQSVASLAGEQPPQLALVPRPGAEAAVVVAWTTKTQAGTRLVSSRSEDGGASFAPPAVVAGSEAAGNRGWQSIAVDRTGRVLAVWLDHRDGAAATTAASTGAAHVHAGHQTGQPMDGAARAQRSQIFFGSLDGTIPARGLTAGVCYCCKTSIAIAGDGMISAAWRHVYAGNVRDIAFTSSRDGGQTFAEPTRISEDGWVLDGCPENGPTLAVDAANRVHAVWPTLVPGPTPQDEPSMALFYATSSDGKTFSPRQPLPTENVPRHPQMLIEASGRITVAWDEQVNGVRRVALAHAETTSSGATQFTRGSLGDAGSFYPVLAGAEGAVVVASTFGPPERSVIRVERRLR